MSQGVSGEVITNNQEVEKRAPGFHKFLIHNQGDHVGVATSNIQAGEKVIGVFMDNELTIEIVAKVTIPLGHKIALVNIKENELVCKYGINIGVTTSKWEVGDYVHTHNMKTARW